MAKILVIDDEEMFVKLAEFSLRRQNHQIITATSGERGIKLAEYELPDLILLDLAMPLVDGYRTIEMLKSNQELSHIPIIVVTAHSLSASYNRALRAGCDAFESKPVDFGNLALTIESLLLTANDEAADSELQPTARTLLAS